MVSLDLRQVVCEVAFANYASGSRLVVSQLLLIQQESHAGGAYADRHGSRLNIEFLFRNLRGHVLAPSVIAPCACKACIVSLTLLNLRAVLSFYLDTKSG